jgi:hypothetical protein
MARDAADRFSSAADLRNALITVLDEAISEDREPEDLVAGWFSDPDVFETELHARVVSRLIARGQELVSEGRKAAALRCYSRVLALAPEDTEVAVRAEIEALLASGRRSEMFKKTAMVAAAVAAVAAVVALASLIPTSSLDPPAEIPEEAETAGDVMPGGDPSTEERVRPVAPRATTPAKARAVVAPTSPTQPKPRVKAIRRIRTSPAKATDVGKEIRVASASGGGLPPATHAGPIWLPIKPRPYADVYVDGTKVAEHPGKDRILLEPGLRQVTFKKTGNRDRTFEVQVPADGTGLKPLAFWWPAIIEVHGAEGHIVQVQGRDLGSTDSIREFPMSRGAILQARVVVLDPKTGPVHEQLVTLQAGGKVVIQVRGAR